MSVSYNKEIKYDTYDIDDFLNSYFDVSFLLSGLNLENINPIFHPLLDRVKQLTKVYKDKMKI